MGSSSAADEAAKRNAPETGRRPDRDRHNRYCRGEALATQQKPIGLGSCRSRRQLKTNAIEQPCPRDYWFLAEKLKSWAFATAFRKVPSHSCCLTPVFLLLQYLGDIKARRREKNALRPQRILNDSLQSLEVKRSEECGRVQNLTQFSGSHGMRRVLAGGFLAPVNDQTVRSPRTLFSPDAQSGAPVVVERDWS